MMGQREIRVPGRALALVVTRPSNSGAHWLVDVQGFEEHETTIGVGVTEAAALADAKRSLQSLLAQFIVIEHRAKRASLGGSANG